MNGKMFTLALVVLIPVFGCHKLPERPEGMPELTPCKILVTFGGEKISGVGVLLQPKERNSALWPAGSTTDEQGTAVLKTAAYYEGVAPGEYFISFQKFAEPEMRPDGMALPAKALIPEKYSQNRSRETITISKEQSEYQFEL